MSIAIGCKVSAEGIEVLGWDIFGLLAKQVAPLIAEHGLDMLQMSWASKPTVEKLENAGRLYQVSGREIP